MCSVPSRASICAAGTPTPTNGSWRRVLTVSSNRSPTRCGRRHGTSTPRTRWRGGWPVADEVTPGSLSDAEIHRAVAATVFDVLLPAIPADAEWARAAAVQLVGLARYAAQRGP